VEKLWKNFVDFVIRSATRQDPPNSWFEFSGSIYLYHRGTTTTNVLCSIYFIFTFLVLYLLWLANYFYFEYSSSDNFFLYCSTGDQQLRVVIVVFIVETQCSMVGTIQRIVTLWLERPMKQTHGSQQNVIFWQCFCSCFFFFLVLLEFFDNSNVHAFLHISSYMYGYTNM
jgi:hypothetical protein